MRIKQSSIQTIKAVANVLEIAEDFLTLKKKGTNWWSPCPFHHEKTASFSIAPAKGIFKCFGCGAAGDAITFLMRYENATYTEALEYIAKKYNIEVEYDKNINIDEAKKEQTERESLLIILDFARSYYQDILLNSQEGKIGLSYFKERNLRQHTIESFQLGYSLPMWDVFSQMAIKKGYNPEMLLKAGLSTFQEEKKQYLDRFRDRVMFPIHNLSGKVIGFGGRILSSGDKKQAKYINSPETAVYKKSEILYGLFQAKKSIQQKDECILVEGYMDVISLHQAGITHAVASSGTSLTKEQIRLIKRFTQQVILIYDNDNAGIKAALRGLDMLLEDDLNVRIVLLPTGEDPDSYVKEVGAESFLQYIQQTAQDFIHFKTQFYLQESNSPLKKAEAVKEVVASISKIADPLKRNYYTKEVAQKMDISEEILIAEANKIILKESEKNNQSPAWQDTETEDENYSSTPLEDTAIAESPLAYQEKESMRLLLNYAYYEVENSISLCQYLLTETEDIHYQNPLYNQILHIFRTELEKGNLVNMDYFLTHEDPQIATTVTQLIAMKYQMSENWLLKHNIKTTTEEETLQQLAFKNILRLKQRFVNKHYEQLNQELSKTDIEEDQDYLLIKAIELKQIEANIAKLLGNVIFR
ncbi:MAG: DNA primase [Cytophagales bacterium]|nr:MAG: DNA primase [Cytophagales bacterium]